MDKLWEHIEHLAPGLALSLTLGIIIFPEFIDKNIQLLNTLSEYGGNALVSIFFLAFAYLLGVTNSSLSRGLFTEVIPVMDYCRWKYFERILKGNKALNALLKELTGRNYSKTKKWINKGSKYVWVKDAKWKRKRRIFHIVSGAVQESNGAFAKEISSRRREARLMRSAVIPISVILSLLYVNNKIDLFDLSITVVVIYAVYLYREMNIADSIEQFSKENNKSSANKALNQIGANSAPPG